MHINIASQHSYSQFPQTPSSWVFSTSLAEWRTWEWSECWLTLLPPHLLTTHTEQNREGTHALSSSSSSYSNTWMIHLMMAHLSKSVKKFVAKTCVLSNLYPFPVLTAASASSLLENSRKKYLVRGRERRREGTEEGYCGSLGWYENRTESCRDN